VPGLDEIERRSRLNEVPGLRRVSGAEITEIEPHARGVAALQSPHTAIVDFVAVANAYADDLRQAGGEIVFGAEVTGLQGARVTTTAGEFGFDRVVICAGLQSDRVSRLAGDTPGPAIVPFRGEYYKINPDRADLVRGLIYPVPDPRYPFLGVHLTRRIDGSVEVGPNAVLALAREGYTWGDIAPGDLAQTLLWPGFRHMARRHWRTGIKELHGSASKRAFVAAAQSYVPDLQLTDVTRGGAGVRAQAVDADGSLVDDFRIHHRGPVTAIRNAPSPAATSSLAIAEHVVTELLDR
jgi:L-2-hydroxyglutarate oxidase LhgO